MFSTNASARIISEHAIRCFGQVPLALFSVLNKQWRNSGKIRISSALALAISVFAPPLAAVNLSASGTGQVLIYPYYTVNNDQQTLLSVVNSTLVGKAVKVRFREAHNGRVVLDFNLYLSPGDVWTATVFALSDAGFSGDGAAIFSADHSCTDPSLTGSGALANGYGFQRFSNEGYTGAASDTGPATDDRTREGHIEMILMSDVPPDSDLFRDITQINGVPTDCRSTTLQAAAGYSAPTLDPTTGAPSTPADGGLFGSASIVNVPNGVFYAYNADALDGFSYVSLYTIPGDGQPTLGSVNDRGNANAATARIFASGESFSATFPGTSPGSRTVDAVSAVFATNSVYNEYLVASDGSIGTDWVVTLPTKYLYVDAQPGGPIAGASAPFAPFEQLFDVPGAFGGSCVDLAPGLSIFDREGNVFTNGPCGFATCPPQPPTPALCLETNVITFSIDMTSVLGSQLLEFNGTAVRPLAAAGWLSLGLGQPEHQLNPASNGEVFHGLPATGFSANNFVNNYVPIAGGGLGVGNYTGAYHHRGATVCTNGNGTCF